MLILQSDLDKLNIKDGDYDQSHSQNKIRRGENGFDDRFKLAVERYYRHIGNQALLAIGS